MTTKPYQNREIDQMLKALTDKMNENHRDQIEFLKRIEAQTTKTNGRVSKLENWRYWMTGAAVVIVLIVIPLVVYAFNLAIE